MDHSRVTLRQEVVSEAERKEHEDIEGTIRAEGQRQRSRPETHRRHGGDVALGSSAAGGLGSLRRARSVARREIAPCQREGRNRRGLQGLGHATWSTLFRPATAWKQTRNEGGEEARRAEQEGETKPRGQGGRGSKAGASTSLVIGRAKTIPMGLAGSSRARAARCGEEVKAVKVKLDGQSRRSATAKRAGTLSIGGVAAARQGTRPCAAAQHGQVESRGRSCTEMAKYVPPPTHGWRKGPKRDRRRSGAKQSVPVAIRMSPNAATGSTRAQTLLSITRPVGGARDAARRQGRGEGRHQSRGPSPRQEGGGGLGRSQPHVGGHCKKYAGGESRRSATSCWPWRAKSSQ